MNAAVKNLLDDVSKVVSFIRHDDNVKKKSNEIVSKIHAHSPDIFVIAGTHSAIAICDKIQEEVMDNITDYNSELYESKDKDGKVYKRVYILKRDYSEV